MALEDIEEFNGDPLYQQVWDHYAAGKSTHDWHSEAVLKIINFNRKITSKTIEEITDCRIWNTQQNELITGAYLAWKEYDGAYLVCLLTETYRTPEENNGAACESIRGIAWGDAHTNEQMHQTMQEALNLWERMKALALFLDQTK